MADEYAKAVAEAVRLHGRAVARLVDDMRAAETVGDVERIKRN